MNKSILTLTIAGLALWAGIPAQAALNIAPQPLALSTGQPPNILLIPDTSESMQEGLSLGRVALDWDNCVPGPDMDPVQCPAGARSPFSKASIVKSVGLNLIQNYRGSVNMGLLSYQQQPPSPWRNDAFAQPGFQDTGPGTVLWRLVHRPGDVRYATVPNPPFYNPNFTGSLMSDTKRFREEHPVLPGVWVFYNYAAPGYHRDEAFGTPQTDLTTYARWNGNFAGGMRVYHFFRNMHLNNPNAGNQEQDPDSGLWFNSRYNNANQTWRITLTDSMRQRGVPEWGTRALFTQLNQIEWRSNSSPGLGYLHVPIGGLSGTDAENDAHWDALITKLQPQRHDWEDGDGNVLVSPEWPLIAAGLTPLQGTMRTARDYFNTAGGAATPSFGANQGWSADIPSLPESCGVNAAIWITDGLPTVRADGTLLGENPALALQEAADAISDFYTSTQAQLGAGVPTYIVGFALPPGVGDLPGMPDEPLNTLAEAGRTGEALMADDFDSLQAAMNQLFQQIIEESQAEFGTTVSGSVLLDDDLAFRTITDPTDWSGEVEGVSNLSSAEPTVRWRASERLPSPGDRRLFTDGGDFTTSNSELVDAIVPGDLDRAKQVIEYIRGDRSQELQNGGEFKNRSTVIGAVVGSEPLVQRQRNFDWARLPENQGGGDSYNNFVQAKASRDPVVWVGSNDGILHAFRAQGSNAGRELFGYVPRGVWSRLEDVAKPSPAFTYTVDGKTSLADARIGGSWRTVLVGSLGAGGRSIYALDVTNVGSGNTLPQLLWERTAADLGDAGNDLGYTFSAPQVARIRTGTNTYRWVVVVGNGYNSPNQNSRLLVFDLANGNLLANIQAGSGSAANPNGLSDLRLGFARPGEEYHRWVYAGDLQGDLWRFDLSSLGSSPARVFNGDRPITAAPDLSYPQTGGNGFIVSFGTGQFFAIGDDRVDIPTQYFYVLHDLNPEGSAPNLTRSSLANRTFSGSSTGEQTEVTEGGNNSGWYAALPGGHRSLFPPFVVRNRVVFSSFSPTEDLCTAGGVNDLYVMDLRSGQGAFPVAGLGEFGAAIRSIEGAPARASVFVAGGADGVGMPPGDPTDPDDFPLPEICINIAGETFCFEDEESREEAADYQFGRRFHWLQSE